LPPAPVGESDPAPPILPEGVYPAVDTRPTSSIRDHDKSAAPHPAGGSPKRSPGDRGLEGK
jgi:hypothetical protein